MTLEPLNADILYLLGSLYIEINDNDKAIEVLKKRGYQMLDAETFGILEMEK